MCDSLYLRKGNAPAIFMWPGSTTTLHQTVKLKQISVGTLALIPSNSHRVTSTTAGAHGPRRRLI